MKILVAGTGGVGGYFGARLLQGGHDVWFMARGENLRALRDRGLKLKSANGDASFEAVNAVERGEEAGRCDAVLFCVKTYDNDAAAAGVAGVVGEGTVLCSLQNGVDNESFLGHRFPQATVIGGVTRIEAYLEESGVIRHPSPMADVQLGPFRPQDRSAADGLASAFRDGGVPVEVTADVHRALWEKLLIIAGIGGVTAYRGCTVGTIREDRALLSMTSRAMEETASVAVARGIAIIRGLPEIVLEHVKTTLPDEAKSSMCRDALAGKPLEVEAINGAVVRYGRDAGVQTPVNRDILDTLLPLHRAALEARAAQQG